MSILNGESSVLSLVVLLDVRAGMGRDFVPRYPSPYYSWVPRYPLP